MSRSAAEADKRAAPASDVSAASEAATTRRTSGHGTARLIAVVRSLRPKQWPKNLLVFAGLVFTYNLLNPDMLSRVDPRVRRLLRPLKRRLPLERSTGRAG